MVTPLDLVKCRIQVDPDKYKNIFNGFKITFREDGFKGLAKGWAPTFFGYSMQGLCKFGLYEVFKVSFATVFKILMLTELQEGFYLIFIFVNGELLKKNCFKYNFLSGMVH